MSNKGEDQIIFSEQEQRETGQRKRLIVISFDGFGANYIKKYAEASEYLVKFAQVSGSMIPAFPSATFVNHNSIMTGLYSENHGIIGNNMYDPVFNASFNTAKQDDFNPRWWMADTFWVAAEKQNIKTGNVMWPGSEVKIGGLLPSFYTKYNSRSTNMDRAQMILDMIDNPSQDPTFIAAYFQRLDDLGHEFGPNDPEIPIEIRNSTAALQYLVDGLKSRGMLNFTDIVVVSDHGMSQVTNFIHLDEVVPNFSSRVFVHEWQASRVAICVVCNFAIRNSSETKEILESLNAQNGVQCFLKDDIPKEWHVKQNQRVGQIMCVSKNGIVMTLKDQVIWRPMGEHGYDNKMENMKSIFFARGPSFKESIVLEDFENVELYNVFSKILGISSVANNGTFEFAKKLLV